MIYATCHLPLPGGLTPKREVAAIFVERALERAALRGADLLVDVREDRLQAALVARNSTNAFQYRGFNE